MIYSYLFMHTQHDLDRNKNVLDISKPQLYGFKRNKAYFSTKLMQLVGCYTAIIFEKFIKIVHEHHSKEHELFLVGNNLYVSVIRR